jgi:hypothetical protein
MSSVVISGDTSGAITLAAPAVSGTNTATLPAATGTVMVSGNMPAFHAYMSAAQALVSGTYNKMQFNTEIFDTNSNYNTSTYRFTPNVAGYYYVTHRNGINSAILSIYPAIYKNGGGAMYGVPSINVSGIDNASFVTSLIYMNGSTDYLEAYAYASGSANSTSGIDVTEFSAILVRTA